MKKQRKSDLLVSLLGLLFFAACGRETAPQRTENIDTSYLQVGQQYVTDPAFRRQTLERSLVNHKNGYAANRLQHYTESGWGKLPQLNPRYRPVRPDDIGRGTPKVNSSWKQLDIDHLKWTDASLQELGKAAFTGYPAQLEQSMFHVLKNKENPQKYGLWHTKDSIGGLIWVELPGGVFPSFTCATCHANTDAAGHLVYGMPNHSINLGKAQNDAVGRMTASSRWGAGRADISGDRVDNPIAIPDLRAVRYQPFLHRTANIRNSREALAVRVETGLILIARRSVRPPRGAMFALSHFIFELGKSLPAVPTAGRGADVFQKECASCHGGPGLSGKPLPFDEVKSNPRIARSTDRTTGLMQSTSLRGLPGRKLLLSDGSINTLEELLRTDRTEHGHYYGLTLSKEDKTELIRFLKKL